jgi:hypothetical protein
VLLYLCNVLQIGEKNMRDEIEILAAHHCATSEKWRANGFTRDADLIVVLQELEDQGLLTINLDDGVVALTAAGIAAAEEL